MGQYCPLKLCHSMLDVLFFELRLSYCILATLTLYNLQTDTDNKHTISSSTCLAHGWHSGIGKNGITAPASGEHTIIPEDGRVRLKHVEE
jgi:hypothetical protein